MRKLIAVLFTCVISIGSISSLAAEEDKILLQLQLDTGMKWEETFDVDMTVRTDEATKQATKESLESLLEQMPEPTSEEQQEQLDSIRQYVQEANTDKPYMSLMMKGMRSNQVKEAIPEEGYTIVSRMKRIQIALDGFMMPPTRVNSEDESSSSSGLDAILLMVNEDLLLKIAPDGQVQSVEGIERIVDKAAEMYGDDPTLKAEVTALIREQQEYAMQDLAPYPNHPVGINDSWMIDLPVQIGDNEAGETQTLPVRMELVKREDGLAYIEGRGEIIMNAEENAMVDATDQAPTSKVPLMLSMSLVVDEKTGLPLDVTMTMDSHMEIPVDSGGTTQSFDSSMTIRLRNELQ